jgi:molybdate transport system permease protein
VLAPLWLSFQVASIGTVLALLVGIPLAALLSRKNLPGRNLLNTLLTAPLVFPPTVLGYYLLVLVGRKSMIGRAYEVLVGSPIVFTRAGLIIATFVGSAPLIIISAKSAFGGVDPSLEQAARTLGASPLRTFFTISLPLSRAGITAGTILGFAKALGDFGVTLMLSGNIPGETQTASLAIYDAMLSGQEHEATVLAALLAGVAVCMVFVANHFAEPRHDRYVRT